MPARKKEGVGGVGWLWVGWAVFCTFGDGGLGLSSDLLPLCASLESVWGLGGMDSQVAIWPVSTWAACSWRPGMREQGCAPGQEAGVEVERFSGAVAGEPRAWTLDSGRSGLGEPTLEPWKPRV